MIADRDNQKCEVCGKGLTRLFSPPRSRPIVPTAYQRAMRAHPDMVEIGDIPQDEYRREMARYKKEADEDSRAAVGKAADEFVEGLGDSREDVLAAMQSEDTTPLDVPEEFVNG